MSSREAQNIISLEDGWSNNIKPKAIDVLEDHLNRVRSWNLEAHTEAFFVLFYLLFFSSFFYYKPTVCLPSAAPCDVTPAYPFFLVYRGFDLFF